MTRFATNPETGEQILYDQKIGDWRPASEQEVIVASQGLAGQAESLVEGATGAQGIAGLFSPAIAERAAALQSVNPTASNVGLAAAVAPGVTGLGVAGVSKLAGKVGKRTASKPAGGKMGFRGNLADQVPAPMRGAADIVQAGAESTPVLRMATDYLIRHPNQQNLNRLVGRGLALTDQEIASGGGKLTDELMGLSHQRIGAQFDEVAERMTGEVDYDQVAAKAIELSESNLITKARMSQITNDPENLGRNLMNMRSDLAAAERGARDTAIKNQVSDQIAEIDAIIEKAVDDPIVKKMYDEARARYRFSLAMEKGQAWGKTNDINPASLDTALRGIYGKDYRRAVTPENAPQEIVDALQGAREAQHVQVGIPTSGTAERLIGASLFGGVTGGATF